MKLEALDTPVPLVDLDRLERNLDRMAGYARAHGLALRPHVKTHKSAWIAAEQLRRGAGGLTCATPRELEVMANAGDDLLLAYPPVGAPRVHRLLALPEAVDLAVSLDGPEAVEELAHAARVVGRPVGVYVELDVGMRRVGVGTPDDAVALARLVTARPPLEYRGIAFYPGHIREPVAEQDRQLEALGRALGAAVEALDRAGLRPPVVSGGSTPTAWRSHELPGLTEIRPGTYVFNDRATAAAGACAWDDCALTVLATVVSTAVPGQAVIDAGSKALGREPLRGARSGGGPAGGPEADGFGSLLDHPEVVVRAMSEEHGILDLGRTGWRPRVGDLVRVVPNHVCVVVHLNDVIHGVRGDSIETSWTVEARGRSPFAPITRLAGAAGASLHPE
ncbi:MAG TPA: alanine racemase [Gemmatimonadales bacterium]|nr:alanine racemase [Gemmatimonadales bacterium]